MRNSTSWGAAIVLMLLLFAWSVREATLVPLESGTVYPPYSTLRLDPLGSKALYESMEALPELKLERSYQPVRRLGPASAIFYLGVDSSEWRRISVKALSPYEALAAGGGRVVIAFLPERATSIPSASRALWNRWGMQFRTVSAARKHKDPGGVPKQSSIRFVIDSSWHVLAQADGFPTMVERPWGVGSLVLVAQSYFLSNEGLRELHDAEVIAALLGPSRHIVFDETHLGVEHQESVAGLIRKYRLDGSVAVLVLLAILFFWKNSTSLIPPEAMTEQQSLSGHGSHQALTALIRRSVRPDELIGTCYREWSRTGPSPQKGRRVRAAMEAAAGMSPADAYRAIHHAVSERHDREA